MRLSKNSESVKTDYPTSIVVFYKRLDQNIRQIEDNHVCPSNSHHKQQRERQITNGRER
jgi:hypothetical protein